jgi:hypothetical protein
MGGNIGHNGVPHKASGMNLTFDTCFMSPPKSNVEFENSTKIVNLLVVFLFPAFALSLIQTGCKCWKQTTRHSVADSKSIAPFLERKLTRRGNAVLRKIKRLRPCLNRN